jgi:Ca2+-binding RTX toxin-like protein
VTDSFTASSSDGTATRVVTVTINGTNDVPVAVVDTFTVTEGTAPILGNVLANDTDVDNAVITVGQFAATTSGAGALTANGTNSILTALGGTVVMNANGTFTYTAPAFIDHDDALPNFDSFAYRATDGSLSSAWTTVNIDIADTNLTANDDVDSLGGSASINGNVITGAGGTVVGGADMLGADAVSIVDNIVLTQGGSPQSTSLAGNVRTIVTSNGTLAINLSNGDYTYTKAPDKSVAAGQSFASQAAAKVAWTNAGFTLYGYDNEADGVANPYVGGVAANGIDAARLDAMQLSYARYRNDTGTNNDGFGVEDSSGSNLNRDRVESGEHLLINLGMSTQSATVTLTDLVALETATWRAYAANGSFITGATGTINGAMGGVVTATIANPTSFAYIVFTTTLSNYRIDGLTVIAPPIITPDIFTYTLTDIDGSNSTATLTINPGVAPVIDLDASASGYNFATTFTQGGAAVSLADTDISITDADSTNITRATITLTNLQAGDVLATGGMPAGITAVVTGNVVTLTGSATLASYQTAIRAVTFTTSSTNTTLRNIDVVVTDGTNISNTATTTVTVGLLNAPVVDLDFSAAGSGFTTTYTENGAAVSIADTDIRITDIDSTNLTGATITLTNAQAGDVLATGVLPGGITASIVGNVVTLSGTSSLANYQTAIQAITFAHTTDAPSTTPRVINVVVTDGTSNSNTAVSTINITPINDGPAAVSGGNTGLEDATSIPVTITGTDIDGTIASFNLSSLPSNGALYRDAAMTILVTTGTDIAASGANSLTLYFKPQADFNSGAFTGSVVPSFSFTAKDNGGFVSGVAIHTITVTAVNDGTPDAINDTFQTVVGTPISFTRAQLVGNDTLFDHARITTDAGLPAGLTYNAGTQTYTYNPAAAGTASFTYTVTDDDGQTDTATVNLTTFNSRTDLATVNESALTDGTGGGVRVVTGNLLTNDAGNSSVIGVTGGVLSGGVYTVTDARGVLQVTAATGAYTYTLNDNVDNDTLTGADTNSYVQTFTYTGNSTGAGTPINFLLTITDDAPKVQDAVVEVAQGSLPDTNLVFVVDISGSMAGEVKNVAADGTVTVISRLAAAKLALISVINEYYSQGGNISIKLVQFEASATLLNGGAAYATKAAAIAAINGLALAGGTNYEDALLKAMNAFPAVDTTKNNTIYFISDGVPTSDNNGGAVGVNPAATTGYTAFVNNNGIKSYAIGIAADISDPTELNNIHNVDSDVSGVKDAAIIVTDVSRLDDVLLASVPTAFGGSVAGSAASSSLNFGADGGYISSLIMKLDTNADGTADTDVTFTYNLGTNQISVVGGFPATGFPLAGSLLTLNSAKGFAEGILIFDFSTGQYTYQTAGFATEGEQFDIKFIATDMDGDTASGKQTIQIIDGKPEANNDVDTLIGNATFMEGNVITATGTDDGNSLQLTTFSNGRTGEDNPVDSAQVSSIVFNGATFNLTTLVGPTASAGGTYTVTVVGGVNTLTWTATTGGSSLIFNEEGYYKYTPPTAELSNNLVQPAVAYGLTNAAEITTAAAAGMSLSAISRTSVTEGSAVVNTPNADGVGVVGNTNTRIDSLESLVINFDTSIHTHGVQGVSIFVDVDNSNLGGANREAFNYTIYNVHGDLIGQFASNVEGAVTIPTNFTGIGKIVIDSGGVGTYAGSYGSISSVTYASIIDTVSTANFAPEIIQYTLTDVDGDTSSAMLRLNIMTEDIAGTSGNNTITGTARNEFISGLAGNDNLSGGAGFDIVKGGVGNDTIDGGADDDQLYGGDGIDSISGGTGADEIYGEAGNDTLLGNDGDDLIYGGTGDDVIVGGLGADTIFGGAGADSLTGGAGGVDVFAWELEDKGIAGTPTGDIINDFDAASVAMGGDVLDLRDILSGESHTGIDPGDLASYLHFEKSGLDTIVHISSTGEFAAGFNPAKDVQTITLSGVDLVGTFTNDQQIVTDLLIKQKLVTD